jgi:cytochrome P450
MERKYDLYSQDFKQRSYETFARMREADPILCQPGLDGRTNIWFFTRYRDVERILRDKRFVRDERGVTGYRPSGFEAYLNDHMLNRDGPDHARLRGLVSQAFTPRRIQEMRGRVEAIADHLLSGVAERTQMDLMADFAFHLPTIVILELLGVPSADRERFKAWSNALIAPTFSADEQAEAVQHLQDFIAYLRGLFAERRATPRDDLVSALLQVEEAGDRLSESELFGTFVLLIVAGHETTVNLIGNSVVALWRHPEQLAALRASPERMPQAVEEFLRYDGSVERALSRWVAEDLDYGGHALKRGDPVILILGAANHDPEVFSDPETLAIERSPNPHLGFGKGPHYCLGAPLARLETEIALNSLLRL